MRPRSTDDYRPAWGADGWPRPVGELDEGDLLLIQSMLELSPFERLRQLERFVNGLGSPKLVRLRTE